MEKDRKDQNHAFLQGGGEMGELTRNYDWSRTPTGAAANWSQSLRMIVAMLLNSKFPMFLWWGGEMIQFYNDAYRPSLGNNGKHPTALGQRAVDCWPEIWEVIYPLIRQVRTTGESTWSEDQLVPIYRNGKIEDVYWTFSYSPVRGDTGEIEGVLVVCTETTEKVLNVQKLIVSRQRFQNLVHDATIGIVVLMGENSVVEIVNEAYGRLIGRNYKDLIGKPLFDIIPASEAHFRPIIDGVRNSGQSIYLYDHPQYSLRADGTKNNGFLNLVYQPYKESDGAITGVMVLCHEVTEQVVAHKIAERSVKRFRNLVAGATVATAVLTGRDMVVELANEAILQIWDQDSSVIGKPLMEFLPELAGQPFPQLLDKVYTSGEMYSGEDALVYTKRKGKLEARYVNFSYKPLPAEEGEERSILIMATDVTNQVTSRRKIEELVAERTKELAEANKKLQKSNEELAQFAYIASHDLQEPIRKVSTFSQMLESSLGPIDAQSKKYLDKINTSSERMLTLIRDVLEYSELSQKAQVFELVDLQKTMGDIRTDFELLIAQKGATVTCTGLPVIEAIPLQMFQLFGNLLSNAVKFGRQDTPPVIDITTRLLPSEEVASRSLPDAGSPYYDIEVKDNGIGFRQSHAEQIFSIFQRLHGKTEYQGTGIGLAMCRKIAQNHHGIIYATGDPGKGASFHVILPAKQ